METLAPKTFASEAVVAIALEIVVGLVAVAAVAEVAIERFD